MKTLIRRVGNFLLRCASAVVLGGAVIVLVIAAARAMGAAQLVLHDSSTCTLYTAISGSNLHIGCKGDPTMPKQMNR